MEYPQQKGFEINPWNAYVLNINTSGHHVEYWGYKSLSQEPLQDYQSGVVAVRYIWTYKIKQE